VSENFRVSVRTFFDHDILINLFIDRLLAVFAEYHFWHVFIPPAFREETNEMLASRPGAANPVAQQESAHVVGRVGLEYLHRLNLRICNRIVHLGIQVLTVF
jgi:hypothetical protein